MKPRIFVSSTFYDLKYIREDLANFIRAHDFEPVLFEDGDIGYAPDSPLDDSCYNAMETSDMALLIIGGNYGSAATGETPDEFKEFLSITRKEFQKGVDNGVPFFVFIDRNVYAEYGIYDMNYKEIEEDKCKIKFRTTKNINVFRFIREIQSIRTLSITEFDKVADIKEFLSKQWADMFKAYLSSVKERKEIERVQGSINRMNILIEKMDKILDVIGKVVLKDSESDYKQIIEENERAKLKGICLTLSDSFDITCPESDPKKRKITVSAFVDALQKLYLAIDNHIKKSNITLKEFWDQDDDMPFVDDFVLNLMENDLQLRRISQSAILSIPEIAPYLENDKVRDTLVTALCEDEYYNKMFLPF